MSFTSRTWKYKETMVVSYVCENCGKPAAYEVEISGETSGSYSSSLHTPDEDEKRSKALQKLNNEKKRRMDEKDFGNTPCPNCKKRQSWQEASHHNQTNMLWSIIAFTVLIITGLIVAVVRISQNVFGPIDFVYVCGLPFVIPILLFFILKNRSNKALKNVKIKSEPTITWK